VQMSSMRRIRCSERCWTHSLRVCSAGRVTARAAKITRWSFFLRSASQRTYLAYDSPPNELEESILVSRKAIWLGMGTSVLVAGLGFFCNLAWCAGHCRGEVDAQATAAVYPCIDLYDRDLGCGLLR
jgi:hypothetical protein